MRVITTMESIWLPHVQSDNDKWTGVTDEKERRRIQNRLAQRARRSRAKNTRPESQKKRVQRTDLNKSETTSLDADRTKTGSLGQDGELRQNGKEHQPPMPSTDRDDLTTEQDQGGSRLSGDWALVDDGSQTSANIPGSKGPATVADCMALATTHDNFVAFGSSGLDLTIRAMHAVAALTHNAFALKIGCGALHTLATAPPTAPASLRPTALQAQVPHSPFVDCIPFPAARDRIIKAKGFVNIDMLADDVMRMGIRCWGRRPWDGRAWELPEQFVEKWWWILDEDLVEMTNYWREERGEEPLVWPGERRMTMVTEVL